MFSRDRKGARCRAFRFDDCAPMIDRSTLPLIPSLEGRGEGKMKKARLLAGLSWGVNPSSVDEEALYAAAALPSVARRVRPTVR